MEFLPFGILLFGLLVVSFNSVGFFFWWKKRGLRQFGEAHGFEFHKEHMSKTLNGLPLSFKLSRVSTGKGHYDYFEASLKLPPSPCEYKLSAEGLLSGLARVAGSREATFGEENFDHAFWLQSKDVEQLKTYLSPARRSVLIYALPDRSGQVLHNTILVQRSFFHPFYGKRVYRQTLERLEMVARVFSTENEELPPRVLQIASSVAMRKTRRFVPWAVLWSVTAPNCLSALLTDVTNLTLINSFWDFPRLIWTVSLVGIASSLLALTGSQVSRVLLQSYFAFLSLLSLLAPLWAAFFLEMDGGAETKFWSLFCGLLLAVLTWGIRHYLKSLERRYHLRPEAAPRAV